MNKHCKCRSFHGQILTIVSRYWGNMCGNASFWEVCIINSSKGSFERNHLGVGLNMVLTLLGMPFSMCWQWLWPLWSYCPTSWVSLWKKYSNMSPSSNGFPAALEEKIPKWGDCYTSIASMSPATPSLLFMCLPWLALTWWQTFFSNCTNILAGIGTVSPGIPTKLLKLW